MKTKILFAGIGGVGGYFGGKVANYYTSSTEVDISFLARGKHLEEIRKNGLRVNHLDSSFVAYPHKVSDSPKDLGEMDYIFLCTKSYDVASVAEMLRPCLSSSTKIITLLNGVDSVSVIRDIYPDNEVVNGCVYILSKIETYGVIQNFGNIQKMFFGRNHTSVDDLNMLEEIFLNAGVDVTLTDSILETTWSKFVFISGVGTSTSYFDIGLGAILEDQEKRVVLRSLLEEVKSVGCALGVKLKDDLVPSIIKKLESLAYDTTSSMQRDFQNENKTELKSLTQYVINEGERLGVDTRTYHKLFEVLNKRGNT